MEPPLLVRPGDKVHLKFAAADLYLCDIPDYNGYAGVAGPPSAKATFQVELNECYDTCITKPAGDRNVSFNLGDKFLQLKHLGNDNGREFPLRGWRYYYHATTSTGKYDVNRPGNSKQFFLINGTDRTIEYGKRFKLCDVAYCGITCVRKEDVIQGQMKIIGSTPQYWLSAKYASTIESFHPMYCDDLIFEKTSCLPILAEPSTDAECAYSGQGKDVGEKANSMSLIPVEAVPHVVREDKDAGTKRKMKTCPLHDGETASNTADHDDFQKEITTCKLVRHGDRVHIRFAGTGLYFCDIPDYDGYAAVVGPAAAKSMFEVQINHCYDESIAQPAGARQQIFKPGDTFLQLKHLGEDDEREHKLKGWRYYYHATTSTGKYDQYRPDNSKQFFLINGTDRTVEYGQKFQLLDVAYSGIACFRMEDAVDTSVKLTGSSPQYWLSAKYADAIKKHYPMYHADLVFENAIHENINTRPSVQGRRIVGNASLRLICGLIKRSGTALDFAETIKLQEVYKQIRDNAEMKRITAVQKKDGPITSFVLRMCGTSVNNIARRSCEAAVRAGELKAEQLIPGVVSHVYRRVATGVWIGVTLCILMIAVGIVLSCWVCFPLSLLLLVVIPLGTYKYSHTAIEAGIRKDIWSAAESASNRELGRFG